MSEEGEETAGEREWDMALMDVTGVWVCKLTETLSEANRAAML